MLKFFYLSVLFINCAFGLELTPATWGTLANCRLFNSLRPAQSNAVCTNSSINSIDTRTFQYLGPTSGFKVTNINLANNQLTSIRVGIFTGLPQLLHLSLRNNLISTIEDNAFAGSYLRSLDLSNNRLISISARTFTSINGGFSYADNNLRSLYLQNNQLLAIDPTAFNTLVSMFVLNLGNNRLTSFTPSFGRNTNLRDVCLNNNPIAQPNLLNPNCSVSLASNPCYLRTCQNCAPCTVFTQYN
jgi:Leucine-rich repeat (LRR) protein